MRFTLLTDRLGPGAGTAGYASRLRDALVSRGHEVHVHPHDGPGVRISLQRQPHAHIVRLGGGWHLDAMRAIHRPPGLTPLVDLRAVHTARVVVANSLMVQRDLAARGIRSVVVRTGVDPGRWPSPEDPRALLFVGHGWRRKNLRAAVRAVAAVPGLPLWVAGRDSRRRIRLHRARAVLGDRLLDLGEQIDPAAVLPFVAAVVHPTLYDPASNLVLEAMASGVPVVTTARDGSAELLPAGLVVRDPLDSDEVARRIRFALAGGRAPGAALRETVSAWPDSRNAYELEQLVDRGW